MNHRVSHEWLHLVVMSLCVSAIANLRAGQEQYGDGKDYSKEVVPVEKSWCETPSLWEVRIGAPAWLAGISGDSGVKGLEASSDVKFQQLLKHLTHFPVALSINARYQRWEFWDTVSTFRWVLLRRCLVCFLPTPMCTSKTRLRRDLLVID
jgi:hypothetical protein